MEEMLIKQIYLEPSSKNDIIKNIERETIEIPIFNKKIELDLRSVPDNNISKSAVNSSINTILKSVTNSTANNLTNNSMNNNALYSEPHINKTVVQEQYTPIINKSLHDKNKIIKVIKRNKKGLLRRSDDNNRHILIKDAPEYESDIEIV